jgi:beta-galactosidase
MIELKNREFRIDGQARLIVAGEIHYFRLQRADWPDRLAKLKAAGGNAVASYIPWLCHEPVEGQIDLEGRTRPELDVGAFIDLCRDHNLYFFARPGPFIMAEMKNEGLPYWLYTKHPEIVPFTWDGKRVPTRTVDYLAPGFLAEVRGWYRAIMAVLAPRLQPRGGNILAVQLDNEVGMLSWISNSPDLPDDLLAEFAAWLAARYDAPALAIRYPFVLDNAAIRDAAIRSPGESYAAELWRDLGRFMRARYARYLATLRAYAEEDGIKGVPFVVNIHGTDQGRGLTFPVGISQLYETYTQAPGYLAGSDHYLGDLTGRNFQDLYLINAFMAAVNTPDQPLTSVEFEAGSGDYGDSHNARLDPATVDFKTRMCVAQGARLLNYYLFTGGVNYLLDTPVHDGNDRIAFTGERHGTAAPVNPEGKLSYTYPRMARVVRSLMAVADKLAVMEEEHDDLALAFIPDYYMTEYKYPGSARLAEIVADLEAGRGVDAWDNAVRALLLACYRFGAVDVQRRPLDPAATPALLLPSARFMDPAIQRKIAGYLEAGGRVLLYGEVPLFDLEGAPCALLADVLGLTPAGARTASTFYYLSVAAEGWAAPRAEVRTHFAQGFTAARGEVILRVAGTGEACGFDIPTGAGRAIVISTAYPCDIGLFRAAMERLGVRAALRHDSPESGIFLTSSAANGERFIHLLNLDHYDKTLHLSEHDRPLLEGREFRLRAREGLMLPLDVRLGPARIHYSTAEILQVAGDALTFRLTQDADVIALESDRPVKPGPDYAVEARGGATLITARRPVTEDDHIVVRWQ